MSWSEYVCNCWYCNVVSWIIVINLQIQIGYNVCLLNLKFMYRFTFSGKIWYYLKKKITIGIFTFMIYFLKFETFSVSLDSMSVALRCSLFFNMERIFTVSLCQIEQYAYLVCMQKAFRLQINNRKVLKNNLLTVETWFIYRRKKWRQFNETIKYRSWRGLKSLRMQSDHQWLCQFRGQRTLT